MNKKTIVLTPKKKKTIVLTKKKPMRPKTLKSRYTKRSGRKFA